MVLRSRGALIGEYIIEMWKDDLEKYIVGCPASCRMVTETETWRIDGVKKDQ
jgi:hypothetical protein